MVSICTLRVRLFLKSFSPKPACLVATENKIFRISSSCWPKFTPLTRKWICTLIFTSIHFQKKRERERERRESPDRREREEEETSLRSHRSSIAIVDRAACRTIAPISPPISPSPRDFIFSSAMRSQFDRIWWIFLLGFVSFVNECGIDSLCASLRLRKCMENWVCKAFSVKMFEWTKHRNWFSVKRILWQTNTWKHFLFRKIAFSENRIFSGNAFTRTKHSLCDWLYIIFVL